MKTTAYFFVFIYVFISSLQAMAAAPSFTNLSQDDVDKISKEFSANFVHPSVMGASTLGKIFGVEAALVAGQTPSPETDAIVKRSAPGNELPNLYHAGLLLGLSVPLGFTGELVMIPKTTSSSAEF